jgi:hypothetical protein
VVRVVEKKRGQKMGPIGIKLLKTNVEKMSTFRFSTILMKTQELNHSLHDVDENTGVIESRWRVARDELQTPKSDVQGRN